MKTASRPYRPTWLVAGATVYRVTAAREVVACEVLEPRVGAGSARVTNRPPLDVRPWAVSVDRLHATAAAAWRAAADELRRHADELRHQADVYHAEAVAALAEAVTLERGA